MLSDEEKKAIKMLDKFITEHKFFNIKQSDNLEDNIVIVLNLIEKQSKGIEELKEINRQVKFLYDDACKCLLNTIDKDKIKAKIEYYEKIDNPVGKRVLESLLEKE